MTWYGAMAWADQLSYQGYDNWRLPYAQGGPVHGYNITGGELGHLFYEDLGGTKLNPIFQDPNNPPSYENEDPDLDLFDNLQSYYYWMSDVDESIDDIVPDDPVHLPVDRLIVWRNF